MCVSVRADARYFFAVVVALKIFDDVDRKKAKNDKKKKKWFLDACEILGVIFSSA